MSLISNGDMAQQFASLRATNVIKSDLARLSATLSSGRVADVPRHLGPETVQYVAINHSLEKLAGYQQVGQEADQLLAGLQLVVARVDAARSQLSEQILMVNDSSSQGQVDDAARAALSGLETMIQTLNTKLNDQSLLAGRDVRATPLIDAADMLVQISATIGPDRSARGIAAAVEAWFTDPNSGFSSTGYRGDDAGFIQRKISPDRQITMSLRADDPAIRDLLKSTVFAAVTTVLPGLAPETKSELVQSAGAHLFGAATGMAKIESRIGALQSMVTETKVELQAEQVGLNMAVNNLVAADPFDTATRLQAVQLQLETHFTVVGRLSQLSLVRFI